MDVLAPSAILWKGSVPAEIENEAIVKIESHVDKWRKGNN
jgi:hypothetical protein